VLRALSDARVRWWLLAAFWAVVIVLGVTGFAAQAEQSGDDATRLDTIYSTLQLITLDYSGSGGDIDWRLQVARFVVPIVAAWTVIQAVSVVFAAEVRRALARFASDHTVVAGLDDVGTGLAHALAEAGATVVAVDPDPARAAALRESDDRIRTVVADPTDAGVLAGLRLDRARRLVAATADDAANVTVATAAAAVPRAARRPALRVAVRLADAELVALLRSSDLEGGDTTRLTYFSLHERAARALLSEHPPFGADASDARVLVIGLGHLGRDLVVALGQQWARIHPDRPLDLTLVDPHASGRWAALLQRHPALSGLGDPTLVDCDLETPTAEGLARYAAAVDRGPTWVAVTHAVEASALAAAVYLYQRLPRGAVPIVVRMPSRAGLGSLLAQVGGAREVFPGISVFPFLDRACTLAALDGGVREQLAQAVHEDYLAGLAPDAPGLRRTWDELDDDERDLSRRRVDGIIGDLAAVGCELAPLRRWGAPGLELDGDQLDRMAEREHTRWYDDRRADGWTHGDVRDDGAKVNPLLLPWAELSEETRGSNRAAARGLRDLLARASFEVVSREQRSSDRAAAPSA